jgi:hypothetical protein
LSNHVEEVGWLGCHPRVAYRACPL